MSKVWRWAAVAVAAIPGAAFADAAQSSAFKLPGYLTVNAGGGAVNPDGSGLKGNTSVDIHTVAGDTTVSGTFAVNPSDATQPVDQIDRKLDVNSTLHGPAGVNLTLKASTEAHDTRQDGALMPPGLARSSATTQQNSATATATLHPLSDVGVTAGISQSRGTTAQSYQPVGGNTQGNTVTTDNRQVFVQAGWSPVPFLSLSAGSKDETMRVTAHGAADAADEYHYVEPSVSATARLWHGAQVKVSGEDAVAPVNTGDYAALAAASGPDTALHVAPSREWRNQAMLTQNLDNGISASVTGTQARIQSTTELAFTDLGAVAPTSVSDGSRQQLTANLSAPLSGFGLADTSVAAHAAWQRSHITDPVTGASRRISGEIPRAANLRITHKDDARHLTWGVTGNLATKQNFYQPSTLTQLRTDSGVGAFVTYRPGQYVVSLNADGLIGGTRSQTDSLYWGSRAVGNVQTTNRSSDASPLVSVSLSRSF